MKAATKTKMVKRVNLADASPEKNVGGRPRVYTANRVQLNTRTSKRTRDRLKKQADRRGLSVSYMVDRALQESLDRWEKEELVKH